MNLLGDGECYTIGVYAHIGTDEKSFMKYAKDCIGLDPSVNGTHAVPAAKLVMAWEACKKRSEIEVESNAHRAVNHLPPQLAIDDFPSARLAFEKVKGREFEDHKLPSENYLEEGGGDGDFPQSR